MIDRDQVLHVARLARLRLDEAEVERMAGELSTILDHIEKIGELDLEGVEPTTACTSGARAYETPHSDLSSNTRLRASIEPLDSSRSIRRARRSGGSREKGGNEERSRTRRASRAVPRIRCGAASRIRSAPSTTGSPPS